MTAILGIDISKAKFDVMLLHQGKQRHKVFPNTEAGFSKLQAWLLKQQVCELHACMEVTGVYGENLATSSAHRRLQGEPGQSCSNKSLWHEPTAAKQNR
jgi:hypothetical protein